MLQDMLRHWRFHEKLEEARRMFGAVSSGKSERLDSCGSAWSSSRSFVWDRKLHEEFGIPRQLAQHGAARLSDD